MTEIGKARFEAVTYSPDPAGTIEQMDEYALATLIEDLEDIEQDNGIPLAGIPQLVLGLARREASNRWMRNHRTGGPT